jgi:spore maturation protein CgeB
MTPSDLRVLICSSSPDALNANAQLREYVAEGFSATVGVPGSVRACAADEAVGAVRAFEPSLVVVFGTLFPDRVDLTDLAVAAKRAGAHLAVWVHDDPYEFDFAFRAAEVADTIFTNESSAVRFYHRERVYHLPLAASPTAHFRPIAPAQGVDVSFCGYAYPNRIRFFSDLLPRLAGRATIVGAGWPTAHPAFSNVRIDGAQLCDLYASSLATVNIGRDLDLANERYCLTSATPGPRTFEAAMAGAAQLYFVSSLEIADYFAPGTEIALIDSADDAAAWVERFRAEPELHRRMRELSQRRALRDHTYANRAATLLRACFDLDEGAVGDRGFSASTG